MNYNFNLIDKTVSAADRSRQLLADVLIQLDAAM